MGSPLLLSLLSLFLVAIASRRLTIYNGQKLTDTSLFPSIALIDAPTHICSSSLVGSQKILTAGHCVCNPDVPNDRDYKVYLGVSTKQKLGEEYTLTSIVREPQYVAVCNDTMHGVYNDFVMSGFDMAVMTLARPAVLSEMVKIGKIDFEHTVPVGTKIMLFGYGYDETIKDATKGLGLLKAGHLKTAKCPMTQEEYEENRRPICVHFTQESYQVCGSGDSGGPIVLESTKEIIAVVSGQLFSENRLDNLYARVKENKNFILENL